MQQADRDRADLLPRSPAGHRQRVSRSDSRRAPLGPGFPLLVVLGPTGTGKTGLAVRLARRFGGEIVGCDALQLYRGFDIATAKPTPAERRAARHHLVDRVDPRQDFSLADYVRLAEKAILEIRERGGLPIVVGGTGLYLRGLLRGVVPAPPRDPGLHGRLARVWEHRGPARVHRWLARLDPVSAARLPPGDRQRVLRALEVALSGAETLGQAIARHGTWADRMERFDNLKIGLDARSEWLFQRLDRRVDRFLRAGLVPEVRRLLESGVPRDANAFKGIGYAETLRFLEGELDEPELAPAIQRSTRRYVKRQRTWFRREPEVHWLDVEAGEESLVETAFRIVDEREPRE